jgi:hypothetical protein
MQSRKRILNALDHELPDRVPVDFGATMVTGMHVSCVDELRRYYGLEHRPVKVHEPFQMLGLIEEDLKEIIGVDVEGVNPRNNMFGFPNEGWREWKLDSGLVVLVPENFKITYDDKGNKYLYPQGDITSPPSGRMPRDGYYFDAVIRQEEIDDEKLDPLDNLEEFKLLTEDDISYFSNEVMRAAATKRAVIVNIGGTGLGDIALVPGPFLKNPKGIRDVEEWYVSTAIRRDYIHAVFDAQTDIAVENLEKVNMATGELIDIIFLCGTDFGTQTGTFCSEETFRELYMPYYRKMNDWIHKNTKWKIFKHCCGAVEPFMQLFIDSGFDIINPVQCSASGMDPGVLKEKYGDKLVFWGGGIDTQKVLPSGTPAEVRTQVLERCRIFSQNGGFVFNAIHNIQAKTPVGNIVAMIDAVNEFNK